MAEEQAVEWSRRAKRMVRARDCILSLRSSREIGRVPEQDVVGRIRANKCWLRPRSGRVTGRGLESGIVGLVSAHKCNLRPRSGH